MPDLNEVELQETIKGSEMRQLAGRLVREDAAARRLCLFVVWVCGILLGCGIGYWFGYRSGFEMAAEPAEQVIGLAREAAHESR
jgi:membrane protein DedA with SNARE-associated domain